MLTRRRLLQSQILPIGSGVAAGDVDSDGWCDLYFCGIDAQNRLFRNLGAWRFKDVTDTAGVGCARSDRTGAVFGDLDGDRYLDLVVNSIEGGTRFFFKDGHGRFSAREPILNPDRGAMVATGMAPQPEIGVQNRSQPRHATGIYEFPGFAPKKEAGQLPGLTIPV